MRIPPVRITLAIFVSATLAALGISRPHAQESVGIPREWLLPTAPDEALRCGTADQRTQSLNVRPRAFVPDGRTGSWIQDPAVLTADYDGTVTLRDFMVPGDVPVARFVPTVDPSVDQPEVETWTRTETRRIAGRTVSIFNPSWSGARVAKFFWSNRWGWDDGGLYWGEFLPGEAQPGTGWGITLRIASRALPRVTVTRVGDDVQYSSHVVNLVMPSFGDGFLNDDHGFELEQVARRFYQEFEDSYDSLAIVPQAGYSTGYNAYHQSVRQDVRGIGITFPFDNSRSYGSAGRLRAAELFVNASFTSAVTVSHELAHQWGSYFDWSRLAGVTRNAAVGSHDPLFTLGETLIGGALSPARRAEPAELGWRVGLTPAPAKLHPYTLYAMGLLPRESVPPVDVFDEQGQFHPTSASTPSVGRLISGGTRTVTVFNVIGMYGERSGPVPSVWHRAAIVVSRDRLLSQREMDYWTYFAARGEDPDGTGVIGYDGVGSFEAATSGQVDVRADIRPLRAPQIVEPITVDGRPFDRDDVRTIQFDRDLPSRYQVGQTFSFSGKVKAADRSDISSILIRFWKYGGTAADEIVVSGRVSGGSSFRMERRVDEAHRGVYQMDVYLFWPGSGSQYSRTTLSPILIE